MLLLLLFGVLLLLYAPEQFFRSCTIIVPFIWIALTNLWFHCVHVSLIGLMLLHKIMIIWIGMTAHWYVSPIIASVRSSRS